MATNSYKVYQVPRNQCHQWIHHAWRNRWISQLFCFHSPVSESRICANALALSHCILGRGSSFASLVQKTVGLGGNSIVQVRNTYYVPESRKPPSPPLKPELVQVTGWDFTWTHLFLLIYQVSCQ